MMSDDFAGGFESAYVLAQRVVERTRQRMNNEIPPNFTKRLRDAKIGLEAQGEIVNSLRSQLSVYRGLGDDVDD